MAEYNESVHLDGAWADTFYEKATEINTLLDSSHTTCKTLLGEVEDLGWSGSSKDAFQAYLMLVEQLHSDLVDVYKNQSKAFYNMGDYVEDYKKAGAVKKVRDL